MKHVASKLAVILAATLALSSPWSAAHAQTLDRVVLDQSQLHVELTNTVDRSGDAPVGLYRATITMGLAGPTSREDAVRVRWTQGGRTIVEQRCRATARVRCETPQTLSASGEIRMEIHHVNGTTDAETLLHDATLEVMQAWDWVGNEGGRPVHVPTFQVAADDRLGFSFAEMALPARDIGTIYQDTGDIRFYFWAAMSDAELPRGQLTFRCRVGEGEWAGYRVTVTSNSQPRAQLVNRVFVNGSVQEQRLYWSRYVAQVTGLGMSIEGSGVELRTGRPQAGQYRCELRRDGTAIRGFAFEVNESEQIVQHAVQRGPNGIFMGPRAVLDLSFPTPSELEPRFVPAAIRRSFGLGMPWPSVEAMATELSALPAAVEGPRFTPAPGARGGRGGRGGRGRR